MIGDYLTQLESDKQDLVNNLTAQGIQDLTGDETFTELVPMVLDISRGADLSDYFDTTISTRNTDAKGSWTGLVKKLENIEISSSITDASNLFAYFPGNSITFSENNNYSSMTKMSEMFIGCSNLTSLDLSTFHPSGNIAGMNSMFYSCQKLTGEMDLSSWDIVVTGEIYGLFAECSRLTRIDIKNIHSKQGGQWNCSNIFRDCASLEFIDCRNLEFATANTWSRTFQGVPNNCEIIVGTDADRTAILSRQSNLTNIKTVAEYEAE